MADRIELTLSFEVDEFQIVDGRAVAEEAIRLALRSLAPYAEGSAHELHRLFELISSGIAGDFCYRAMQAGMAEHQLLCSPNRSIDDIDAHLARVRAEMDRSKTPPPPGG